MIGTSAPRSLEPNPADPSTQDVTKISMKKESTKTERKSMAAELGSRGGKSIARKRGKAYMKKIGKRGAKARWNDHRKQPE